MGKQSVKTGFEDTGERDDFGNVIDFDAPDLESNEAPVEEKPVEQPPVKPKQEKKEAPKKEMDPPDDAEDEFKFLEELEKEEADKGKEKGKEEEKKDEDAQDEEDPIFKLPDEEIKAIETKEIEKQLQFSYADLAQELGIPEFKEGDRKDFVGAVQKAIDDAKTKVDFDLSKMEPEEQQLIKFFRSGGKVDDILNPTSKFDEFLTRSPEDKAIYWLMNDKKIKESEARDLVEEMTENGEFAKYVKQIDEEVTAAKKREQQKILEAASKEYEIQQSRNSEKTKQQKAELVKTVKDMEQFMGMKLPEKIKNHLAAEVETGRFREVMDTPRAQLFGRLYMLFGDQILKGMEAKILEKNREGFNKGKESVHADLHNIEQRQPGQRSVEESRRSIDDVQNPLSGFLNIDEDAVPGRD